MAAKRDSLCEAQQHFVVKIAARWRPNQNGRKGWEEMAGVTELNVDFTQLIYTF
jgi:hypothetical protein